MEELELDETFIALEELENINLESVQENGKRFYLGADGLKYPSVTTVTGLLSSEQIKLWKKRIGEDAANKISNQAARRGTKFHQLCEDFLRDKVRFLSTKTLPEFSNILEEAMFKSIFEVLKSIDVRALEAPLYSDILALAGRVDCIGYIEDKLCVIDFKTSSKPKKDEYVQPWMIQTTAYALMVEELTNQSIDHIIAIVAVEGHPSQIFIDKPEHYVDDVFSLRERYRVLYGV